MDDQLKELLTFLHDRNPQVRQIALSNLLAHTPAGAPNRDVFFTGLQGGDGSLQGQTDKDPEPVRDLKLLCRDQLAIAHDAFRALVNLTDSLLWIQPLSDVSFLVFLVSYILHPPSVLADLASMLLSNLTAQQSVCSTLLSLKIPIIEDPTLSYRYYPIQSRCGTSPTPPSPSHRGTSLEADAVTLLIDAFASSAKLSISHDAEKSKSTRKGDLHFLASVFANLSVIPAGRVFFVTPRDVDPLSTTSQGDSEMEFPLSKLVPFTEHPDVIRRGGCASVIKNCSFHTKAHRAILSSEDTQVVVPPSTMRAPGVNALTAILLPLAGPEEFDLEDQEKLLPALQFLPPTKEREADGVLRLTHMETLLLLCTTRWGRDFLRGHGVYEIVRATHMAETVDKVSEHIERLVDLLKRDERGDGGGDTSEDASGDEKIEEV